MIYVGLYRLQGGLVAHYAVVGVVDWVEKDGLKLLVAVGSDRFLNGFQFEREIVLNVPYMGCLKGGIGSESD